VNKTCSLSLHIRKEPVGFWFLVEGMVVLTKTQSEFMNVGPGAFSPKTETVKIVF
jgi:hypothetical protein